MASPHTNTKEAKPRTGELKNRWSGFGIGTFGKARFDKNTGYESDKEEKTAADNSLEAKTAANNSKEAKPQ